MSITPSKETQEKIKIKEQIRNLQLRLREIEFQQTWGKK